MKHLKPILSSGLSIVLIVMTLSYCTVSNSTGENSTSDNNFVQEQETQSKIIFLNYTVEADAQNGYQVEFVNKIIANGEIKSDLEGPNSLQKQTLQCLALDENKRVISTRLIDDPLNRVVEYVNDEGGLEMKEIHLDSSTISIRMQLDAATKHIAIGPNNDTPNTFFSIINLD